jgi:hypothetical protein
MKSQKLILACLLAAGLAACQPKQETQEGLGAGGNPELKQDSVTYADTMGYSGWDSVNADTGRSGAAPKY